ncbi:hypothetical protein [Paenarthrobacter sp. PH39-S1]|uniref:hypothetical protein n=1 Tax=Paenarthrobacter sp. PH39-S1 TaxID=3046204 RepID=UPI0024BA6978|nr:hypothetical protein [Paenarthrobacter sp. PH39-S1]MDJ0356696.1 hypothetical protein [Paenarthrobacter sp. PH39-S1]
MSLSDAGSVKAMIYAEETEPGITNSGRPMLAVSSAHSVPQPWMEILQGIEMGKWPAGFVPGTPNSFLFDFYPKEMQDFCGSAFDNLKNGVGAFFGLMRWRLHDDFSGGDHLSLGKFEWSADEMLWYTLRQVPHFSARIMPQIRLGPEIGKALDKLVKGKFKEPLGREIWHVAVNTDHRTSVILAVIAVEIEVKRLISETVPDSEWLIANLPAPPVVRLIRTYLPMIITIPTNLLPPNKLMNALDKAIKLRNTFVHGGFQTSAGWAATDDLSAQEVAKVLETCSDLLCLFDLYRGHDWAISHLSEETRRSIEGTTT